ncbi:hypothetical protein P3T43_001071 [Paraburkholderia sp. GAS41]|jgi:hypothetical protein|uniref:DUF4336 domain-containing protein n=1 Tax=Paraburkholderia sp. GAS41 TaxID=3035134 RepID=UPI003D24423F
MPQLQQIADNIWTVAAQHAFLGMHLGTRMTVVRLASGGLWLHSPVAAYPNATLHGPHALRRKRKDLPFSADLSDTPHPDWLNDLAPLVIRGCLLQETVFFHQRSRTLIASDLVENFKTSPHWLTRMYLKVCGLEGKITWGGPYRLLYRNRQAARACIDRLLEWPFERVVIAHGDLILRDAHLSIERGMAWLKA